MTRARERGDFAQGLDFAAKVLYNDDNESTKERNDIEI